MWAFLLGGCKGDGSLPPLVPNTADTQPYYPPLEVLPPLELAVAPLEIGRPAALTVTGATPGAALTVWRGTFGGESCPPELDDLCLPVAGATVLETGLADAAGEAALTWSVQQGARDGQYPVLVATDDAGRASLPVMRRVWAEYPELLEAYVEIPGPFGGGPTSLVPGIYQDLAIRRDEFQVGLAEGEVLAVRTHVWAGWDEVSCSVSGPPGEPEPIELQLPYDRWFQVVGESSATWTVSVVGYDDDGLYELEVRVLPSGSTTGWYRDTDRDGYGNGDVVTEAPLLPPGFAWRAGDCDDARGNVNPDAFDVCGDGTDQDCNGADKPCSQPLAGEAEADDVTVAVLATPAAEIARPLPDIDGDGQRDLVLRTISGEVLALPAILGEQTADDATVVAGAPVGLGGVGVADLDGNGVTDLVLSDTAGDGAVYVFSTPVAATLPLDDAWARLGGSVSLGALGSSLDVGGDADGDGNPDLLVAGAALPDAYVVTAVPAGDSVLAEVARTQLTASFGLVARFAGDGDGDGRTDLVVSEGWDGSLHLLSDPPAGAVLVRDLPSAWFTESTGLFTTGDLDGDGRTDLVASAIDRQAYVWTGPLSGPLREEGAAGDIGSANELWELAAGDLDGDHVDDLAVYEGATERVFLVYGPITGSVDLPADADATLGGSGGLLTVDDYDGDGLDDLLCRPQDGEGVQIVRGAAP